MYFASCLKFQKLQMKMKPAIAGLVRYIKGARCCIFLTKISSKNLLDNYGDVGRILKFSQQIRH